MTSHTSQQELQDLEDHNINLPEAKDIQALLLMSGELDTACSFFSMKLYPSMDSPNSSVTLKQKTKN